MQWMRWLTGTRTGRAHRGGRYLACGLVLTLVLSLLAACGTSSSITTPNTNPCAATQAPGGASSDSVRYWVPGVFVVGLISNDHALDPDRGDVLTPVTRTVDTILASRDFSVLRLCGAADHPQSSGNPPDLMIFGSANDAIKVGIASFELVQRGSSIPDQADADLTSAVDLINKNVQPVSVNGATMWLAGATPDLLGLGGSGWNGGGSLVTPCGTLPQAQQGQGSVSGSWTQPLLRETLWSAWRIPGLRLRMHRPRALGALDAPSSICRKRPSISRETSSRPLTLPSRRTLATRHSDSMANSSARSFSIWCPELRR